MCGPTSGLYILTSHQPDIQPPSNERGAGGPVMATFHCTRSFRKLLQSYPCMIWTRTPVRGQKLFHTTAICQTDGVYQELTAMRVKTPFIEALRRQKEEGNDPQKRPSTPAAAPNRELTPKKMSDSYYRVVWEPYASIVRLID